MAGQIEDTQQFEDSPTGWHSRWKMELSAAREAAKAWHTKGDEVVKRFLDVRTGEASDAKGTPTRKWPLFTANIQTQRALMYGKTPEVEVSRKFEDADDDAARVAGTMQERHLNCDIQRDNDTYSSVLYNSLTDEQLPGLGAARLRYVAEFEPTEGSPAMLGEDGEVLAEEVPPGEQKTSEDVEVDYVYWKDILYSPARTWNDVRWIAFRSYLSREDDVKRFGEKLGAILPLNAKSTLDGAETDARKADPWGRTEMWEIWDKETREVFWYVDGFDRIVDRKPDTLQLEGFWPCPKPLLANVTTSAFKPTSDFYLAQDLYNEIDEVSTRITALQRCIKVAGVYDKTAGDLSSLFEALNATVVGAENWQALAAKGGVRGVVDWIPLDQFILALDKLREYRSELVAATYQITGYSDIVRGQAGEGGVTATEQAIKARFASVRMQQQQDEFARFASDIMRLKAEIIAKHFDDETIIKRSNIEFTADGRNPQLVQAALKVIRDKHSTYRIEVKPEAVAMQDFAQLKAERTEFLMAMSTFLQSAAPMAQQMPGSLPFLLQMLQWAMAGLRGSSTIEGVLDQAIAAAQQMAMQPQQTQQDPKLQVAQLKAQTDQQRAQFDMQKEQAKLQGDLVRIQAETQAKDSQERSQAVWNIAEARGKKAVGGGGPAPAFTPGMEPGGTL